MISRPDDDIQIRAMPLVFVVIWSSGFIVARYGMPFAPPKSFLALRYLVPPITALIAWVLFSEPITVVTILSTALTAFWVSLVVRAAR